MVTLELGDGSLGTIAYLANGDRGFPKEKVEVFGGGRVAVLEDFRRLEIFDGGRKRAWTSWLRQDKGHRGLWQAFVDSVRDGGPPPIPYADIFAVSQAILDASASLRSGEPTEVAAPLVGE